MNLHFWKVFSDIKTRHRFYGLRVNFIMLSILSVVVLVNQYHLAVAESLDSPSPGSGGPIYNIPQPLQATGDATETSTATITETPTPDATPPTPTITATPGGATTATPVRSSTPTQSIRTRTPTFTPTGPTATFTALPSDTPTPTTTLEPLPTISQVFPLPSQTLTPTATDTPVTAPGTTLDDAESEPLSARLKLLVAIVIILWLFLAGFLVFYVRRLNPD